MRSVIRATLVATVAGLAGGPALAAPTLFGTAEYQSEALRELPQWQAVLARIQKLRGDAKPQWGKMDAARMVAHGAVGLKLAMGDMKLKRVLIGLTGSSNCAVCGWHLPESDLPGSPA